MFCDDVFIRNLNRDFRDKDESTDVLSFPQIEGDEIPDILDDSSSENPEAVSFFAGDIIISLDTVEKTVIILMLIKMRNLFVC